MEDNANEVYPRAWITRTTSADDSALLPLVDDAEERATKSSATPSADVEGGGHACPRFRLVTYNVLTDNCIRPGYYLHCPPEERYMSARWSRILADIVSMAPDVVCLQEVDADNFRSRVRPAMEDRMGYDGRQVSTDDGQGLAVFWKRSVFQVVDHRCSLLHEAACSAIKEVRFYRLLTMLMDYCNTLVIKCNRLFVSRSLPVSWLFLS